MSTVGAANRGGLRGILRREMRRSLALVPLLFAFACAKGTEASGADQAQGGGESGAGGAATGGAGGDVGQAGNTAGKGGGGASAGAGGTGTSGSGTAGAGTSGSGGDGTAGSGTSGSGGSGVGGTGASGSAGSGGSDTAGSGGTGTAGSGTSGSGGSDTAGSGGTGTAGSGTSGSGGTAGSGTGGSSGTSGTGGSAGSGGSGTGCPGTIVDWNWNTGTGPTGAALKTSSSVWSVGTASAGPADGKTWLATNPGGKYPDFANDWVQLPTIDLSSVASCQLQLTVELWREAEKVGQVNYDGGNMQFTVDPAPTASSAWAVVPGASMQYDGTLLGSCGSLSCIVEGQPAWTSTGSPKAKTATYMGAMPGAQVTVRFTFFSDDMGDYAGLYVRRVLVEAKLGRA